MTWLNAGVDGRGLAAFRILFGGLMVVSVVRFWARGWIEQLYLQPSFHFTYLGFEWVRPWPGPGMYVHFAVMGLAAFSLMWGFCSRFSAAVLFATFTYAELIEKAAYLNHYYLVSLLALLLACVPCGATMSVDAWRRGGDSEVRRWSYALLRAQVAVVYVFAGLAKLNGDWLWRAEPLYTWLGAHSDVPLLGSLLTATWTAHVMSWFGMLYDLSIVGWLLWPRTRAPAYATAVVFHGAIWLLFPVGVFSFVMLVATTVFFDPGWPGRLGCRRVPVRVQGSGAQLSCAGAVPCALYVCLQVLVPVRHTLFPGDVNWTEQGFRFAWRVMLIEKNAHLEYKVVADGGRGYRIFPRREMGPLQHRMLVTQPDMIHQYALLLADRFRREGHRDVHVYADSTAALNGRPSQRLVDPAVDLAAQPRDGCASAWIVPLSE